MTEKRKKTNDDICGLKLHRNQDQLKLLLSDGNAGNIVGSKALSLNLNFSFLNCISLLLISSSYSCPHEVRWTPFRTLYFEKKF